MNITEEELREARSAAHAAYAKADALLMKWKQEDAPKEPTHEEKNRAVIREYKERKARNEKVELWEQFKESGRVYDASGAVDIAEGRCEDKNWTLFIREPKEPTLEERNAAVKALWDAMTSTDKAGCKRDADGNLWTFAVGGWTDSKAMRELDEEPLWSHDEEYRLVKVPAPKFVPFTRETAPIGEVFVEKSSGDKGMLIGASKEAGYFGLRVSLKWAVLLDNFTLIDGRPCGTEASE